MILLLAACGPDFGNLETSDIESLRIEPSELTLETELGSPASARFTAILVLNDGTEIELAEAAWASSNSSAGEVHDDGGFLSADANGGVTEISASYLGTTGTSTVTVIYTEDLFEEGADAGLAQAFESAQAGSGGPELSYPPDGIRVPRNLAGLGFSWDGAQDVSRLRLRSEITDISVYTSQDTWTATSDLWERAVASNRGGEVAVTVQSGAWDGSSLTGVSEGSARELTVNRFDARGSVLYWATSDQAIRRVAFGETTSTSFWSGVEGASCVGCHVVSNERNLMVVTHDGVNGVFEVVDISDPEDPVRTVRPNDHERFTFKALTPDGEYILASNFGEFALYRTDGNYERDYPELPPNITMPDISPDGRSVTFIQHGGAGSGFEFLDGDLVIADLDPETHDITNLRTLVDTDSNVFYPAFSPDGAWIAYNRGAGRPYSNITAELWLVSTDGSIDIPLDAANSVGDLQNSWSRWGPLPDDDVLWLAFSSRRTYPLADQGSTQPQIWVTGIDEALAAQGEDPSSPAFWLPGQDTRSDNHLPAWWDE